MPMPNMKSFKMMRRIGTAAFVADSQISFDIPRNYDLNKLELRVFGNMVIGTQFTAVKANAPSQMIERIDIFADGNKTFRQSVGIFPAIANNTSRFAQNLVAPGITVATHPYSATYYLPMVNSDGPRPKDSALHTQFPYMSLLTMRVTTGTATDCFDATAGVMTSFTGTLELWVEETAELDPADRFEGRFLKQISYQEAIVTAANSALQFQLPIGAGFRQARIFTTDGPAAYRDTPVDTLVNSVKVLSGLDVRFDMSWTNLRAKNIEDYDLNPRTLLPTGIGIVDLCPDGHLNTMFDLRSASQAFIVMDVAAPVNANGGKIALEIEEFTWIEGMKPPGA